jgi:hypothetical protein
MSVFMAKNDASVVPSASIEGRIDSEELVLSQVRESLRNLQFGHVQIIVQDGVVVQIDRLERRRIARTERHAS